MLNNHNNLEEFKEIYLKNFWQELSDKEALELSTQLLIFFKTIYLDDIENK